MNHINRSQLLHTVPQRKLIEAMEQTVKQCPTCSLVKNIKLDHGLCAVCSVKNKAYQRYAEANIPVIFWNKEMKEFKGDEILLKKYQDIVEDLNKSYLEGASFIFNGSFGIGKTMTCCNILKLATQKGFSCLYTNLSDIVTLLTSNTSEDKTVGHRELLLSDFICIDEFDQRYISNDKASDLFGKSLENVLRTRCQNKLPIMLCTNSPNVIEGFNGSIKLALSSLMSHVQIVSAVGKDFRKELKQITQIK